MAHNAGAEGEGAGGMEATMEGLPPASSFLRTNDEAAEADGLSPDQGGRQEGKHLYRLFVGWVALALTLTCFVLTRPCIVGFPRISSNAIYSHCSTVQGEWQISSV